MEEEMEVEMEVVKVEEVEEMEVEMEVVKAAAKAAGKEAEMEVVKAAAVDSPDQFPQSPQGKLPDPPCHF